MNNYKINGLSLAANVVLTVACAVLVLGRTASTPPTRLSQIEPTVNHSSVKPRPAAKDDPNHVEPRSWVEVLRSEGVPAGVVARLALADFDDRWQARQAAAQEAYNRGDLDADGLAALARQHDIEQENDLRARLGEEAFRAWDATRLFQQFNLGNVSLTASETNSLYDLAASLREHLRRLQAARDENTVDQATFNAEQTEAQGEFEKQLRALLGDERYSAIRGTSPTVGELRRSLRGLDVDDQQFATLLQAQEKWDASRAQLEQQQVESGDTNLQQQIAALTAQHDQTFADILGTNGLALFQKQQDSRYVELQKNAARWGIDNSNIDYIYNSIQMYEKAAADYERKVRDAEAQGVKVDTGALQQPLRKYAQEMAQYVRSNLSDAQYNAISKNQILPFGP